MRAAQKFYTSYEQRQSVVGQITALMNELSQCAPHPDHKGYNGPLFIAQSPHFKASNDHDGTLGSMMMESLLGTAFASAASEALAGCSEEAAGLFEDGGLLEDFDANSTLECYSEYIKDVEKSTLEKATKGQGTFARMSGKSISGAFNLRSSMSEGMQAFYNDMPKRLMIEKELSSLSKQLMDIDNPAYRPMPAAAPAPAFAA